MDLSEEEFWRKPTQYRNYYHMRYCGYLDIGCCVVTVISNSFIVAVFSRKNMISSINTIFIHMAINELLAIVSYLPRVWHEHFRVRLCSINEHRTYMWERISLNAYFIAFVFRHISVWMAIMLAMWRYIGVIHPLKERDWCNINVTRRWIRTGYIFGILITIPLILGVTIEPSVRLIDQNGCPLNNFSTGAINVTIYELDMPLEKYHVLYRVVCISYGFGLKILPAIVLGTISYKLIRVLIKMKEHRKEMITTSKRNNSYNFKVKQRIEKQTDRTTKILLIILVLFIVGEIPHGIFGMTTAFLGPRFFWNYYYYAMEIFNTFTHFSESFNFVIYCSMSNQFRKTFKKLFWCANSELISSNQLSNKSTASSSSASRKTNYDRSASIQTISSTCA